MRHPAPLLVAAAIVSIPLASLRAQCGLAVVPGFPHLGPDGPVDAVTWYDPDGAGPMGVKLFVGGRFDVVERTPCAGAALYDASTRSWSALPGGVFDRVTAANVDTSGALVVAGSLEVGATTLHRVASYDGVAWTVLGGSFDAPVSVIENFGGDVVVGGAFQQHGGQPLGRIARWTGAGWSGIGGGVAGTSVAALCVTPAGELVVGGTFTAAGGMPAANIARWNGSSWQALGSGLPAEVTSIVTFSNGDLFATGLNQNEPSQWTGSAWVPLAGLTPPSGSSTSWVTALAVGQSWSGEALFAAGSFSVGGFAGGLAWWEPNWGWQADYGALPGLDAAGPSRLALALLGSPGTVPPPLAVAGPFGDVNGLGFGGVTIFSGYEADPLGAGVDGPVLASAALPDGDLLLGGAFRQVHRTLLSGLARGDRDGVSWTSPTPFGGSVIGAPFQVADVRSIVRTRDGDHLLAGLFFVGNAGGSFGGDIARYDGTNLTAFGPSPFSAGGAFAVLQRGDGTVYCGGTGVFRRDGASWTLLSTVASGLSATCYALAELPNGDVVVGGDLQVIPGAARPGVMRWNGTSWQPLGAGLASVVPGGSHVVLGARVRPDGVLFVVGLAGTAPFCASFDGAQWQALPAPVSGVLRVIEFLPDGDVVVGGRFDAIGGVPAASLARWNGSAWQALGDGVRQLDGQPGEVYGLCFADVGDLHVVGEFARHDGLVSVGFTRVRSLCAAMVQSFGVGCVGSGGQNELRGEAAAWLGGTMRSVAVGMPSGGLAVEVLGLAPGFALLPTPGCALWVDPAVTRVVVPSGGRAALALPIPTATTLLGQVIHQQVVGVELVGGAIVGFTSTNRLQHTIGVF